MLIPTLALILAACSAGSGASAPTSPLSSAAPAATVAATQVPPAGTEAQPAVALDPWQTEGLTDVRTGETFAIADLAGKVVVIEPMAIWCSNCARQQKEAAKALDALASDDVVYISLDIDPGERASDLAAYADERGFDWRFVVADRALSRALAQAFGDQVLSPPSTPKIILGADGRVVGPNFGIQDASAIEAELRDQLS
jgi:thiol-disulfide isomerase/thioredoxin